MNQYGCDRCGDTCVQAGVCQVCGHKHPIDPAPTALPREHQTQAGYDSDDPKAWRLERLHNTGVW